MLWSLWSGHKLYTPPSYANSAIAEGADALGADLAMVIQPSTRQKNPSITWMTNMAQRRPRTPKRLLHSSERSPPNERAKMFINPKVIVRIHAFMLLAPVLTATIES